jgi:6-phosphogluconolactonase
MRQRTVLADDPADLVDRVSTVIAGLISEHPPDRPFRLALSGGSTPRALFDHWAREDPPRTRWENVELYWADERCVPPSDPRSNFGVADHTFIRARKIPPERVRRMRGEEADQDAAAREYEMLLRRGTPVDGPPSAEPVLDLVLLGVGPDGHTASLFPGHKTLEEDRRWTVPEPAPSLEPRVPRLTLTLPVFANSARVFFLVTGPEKRAILERVLSPAGDRSLPAARVRAREELVWFVDRAAASTRVSSAAQQGAPR